MVMGRRPGVRTAPAPIAAVDTLLLGGQTVAALARVPFRQPFAGVSNRVANLGASVTREVVRSFMGYTSGLPVDEFRSVELMLDELCRIVMPVVRRFNVDFRQVEIGGVPGLLYTPRGIEPMGMALYLHGGGYIGTSPRMYALFTARLCHQMRCPIFVADYRLAPEFPYPAGLEDAQAVLRDLVAHGVPPERLVVAGDSGGGGLATSLVLSAGDDPDVVRPAGLVLFSPEVDLVLDEPSVTENAEKDVLPWNIPTGAYLHGTDAASGAVSADHADLSNFPPTLVVWGSDEMFRDPIRRFAAHLEEMGVPTHVHEEPGMFHDFPILMPWAEASHQVYGHVGQFVRNLMGDAPPLPPSSLDMGSD